jgi:thioredoxin 1
MAVKSISSKAEFHALVSSTRYVALEAHAAWNGPSRFIEPIFFSLAESLAIPGRFVFARFDTDEVLELSNELGVRALPAFFFFENGEVINSLFGANPPALQEAVSELSSKAKA